MVDLFKIEEGIPLPASAREKTGMSSLIRKMKYMDSITIPGNKLSSTHPSAKAVGAKIKTRKNPDGTVTLWRTDRPADSSPQAEAAPSGAQPSTSPGWYCTMEPYGSRIWREGPKPAAQPEAPDTDPRPEAPIPTIPIPDGLHFTIDDVFYLGHRHSTLRSLEGTRAILNAYGCESSYVELPQSQLNALCFDFIVSLGSDNHPGLPELQPKLQPLFTTMGWKPHNNESFQSWLKNPGPNPNPTPDKPFSLAQLRFIFYRYADVRSIEKAREVLAPFNCSHSISQAYHDLSPEKTRELVAALGGINGLDPAPAPTPSIFD